MKIQQVIRDNRLELLFQQGSFGIEKESQRVHADGSIMVTEHPKCFGSRSYHLIFKQILPKANLN